MKSPAKSFKWIFFRVINYIQIVVAVFIIVLIIIGTLTSGFTGAADVFLFILPMLTFGTFIANGLSNLYLIEKFYPNQLPSKATSRFNMVTYILLIIFSLLLIIATFADFFTTDIENSDNTFPLLSQVVFGFLGLTSIPIWFLQMQLRATLKRNYYMAFDEFLETDNP